MSKIFISYRRQDSRLVTNRIYDRIRDTFGKRNVFKDVDNIPPGKDFRGVLREATANCQVMLVIIGPDWLDIKDKNGNRRLDNLDDFVRLEVETGLQRDGTLVIPVLVEQAQMPSASLLPDSLKELAYNNAFRIDDDPRFHQDMDTLITYVREHLSGIKVPAIDWRWIIGVVLIPIVAALIGGLIQNPEFFGLGVRISPPSPTTEVAIAEDVSEDDARATGAAQAYATLTALAPTNTPTITLTPTDTPISSSDIQRTAQAEIFATETYAAQTQAIIAQETQNAVLTEQFIAGSTATYIIQLSLTPLATNTPVPPSPTTDPLQQALQRASTGVNSNTDWNIWYPNGFVQNFDRVEMVLVPAGCFTIGANPVQVDERNGNEVCPEPFWIDKYEVTQGDFNSRGGANEGGSYFDGNNRPVESITWFEARIFCLRRGARLPTEAEWEYAARGPDELIYPWGNEWNTNNAVWDRSPSEGTANVGSIPAGVSWIGAMDMSGNVWEWTNSLYVDYPYNRNDGRERDTGDSTDVHRVLRGGSFGISSVNLRSANRYGNGPNNFNNNYGFRCVRS